MITDANRHWFGWASIVVGILLLWALVAFIKYKMDAPAREYAKAPATQQAVPLATTSALGAPGTQVVVIPQQQEPSFWPFFFWGYMLGGWGNHGGYDSYRNTVNNTYYTSDTYQTQKAQDEAAWGTSWGASNSSSDSNDSSWSSDNSGSWGGSSDSWGSGSSGSWGGSSDSYSGGSSWSSESSGSWGE